MFFFLIGFFWMLFFVYVWLNTNHAGKALLRKIRALKSTQKTLPADKQAALPAPKRLTIPGPPSVPVKQLKAALNEQKQKQKREREFHSLHDDYMYRHYHRELLDCIEELINAAERPTAPESKIERHVHDLIGRLQNQQVKSTLCQVAVHYKELLGRDTDNRHVHETLLDAALERAIGNVAAFINLEKAQNPEFDPDDLVTSVCAGLSHLDNELTKALRTIDRDRAIDLKTESELLTLSTIYHR